MELRLYGVEALLGGLTLSLSFCEGSPSIVLKQIRVITKLPNSEQSSKAKFNTHKYINRHLISQQPANCENRNDPDLVQAFPKK